MGGMSKRRGLAVVLLIGAMPACSARVPVEELPAARETLAAIGKRLSRSMSERELTAVAARADRVLAVVNRRERDALARGLIRFRVDRPVLVEVAAPARSVPFWLDDQGFTRTGTELTNADGTFLIYRKPFGPGWVGLGVNGLDASPGAHYAVFVRPQGGGRPPSLAEVTPRNLRQNVAEDGAGPYLDVEKPFRRLPAELRGATLLQTRFEARTATVLANGRVWKTHVPSGPRPDQVAIAFGTEGTRSLVWTWRTDPTTATTALRLAPAAPGRAEPADPGAVRIVRGRSRRIDCEGLLNDPAIRRHRAVATGLEPDTVYAYALGDGSEAGWSPWRTVKTGPAVVRDFSFMYLGDAQCFLEGWGTLLHRAHRHRPDVGFLLLAGDLVDRGNERTNWDHFFLRAAGVFDAVPMMPAVGNHEYLLGGPRLYRSFFELPKNGPAGIDANLVYAFEYSDAIIAVLDSNLAIDDPGLARLQGEWLDATLAKSKASWKFVMFHHPVYASHPTREYPALRDAWVPIFDRHRVDMVLQGHDHAYLRSYPMRAGRRVDATAAGTVYVVSVSGAITASRPPATTRRRAGPTSPRTRSSTSTCAPAGSPTGRSTATAARSIGS